MDFCRLTAPPWYLLLSIINRLREMEFTASRKHRIHCAINIPWPILQIQRVEHAVSLDLESCPERFPNSTVSGRRRRSELRSLIVIALDSGPTLFGEPVKHSHVSSYITRERGFLHLDTASTQAEV